MFLQTSNLCLEIITLPPGLESRANSVKARRLHSRDFVAFTMNIEHLTTLHNENKMKGKKYEEEHSPFQIF
jgi:hypothetical protein